MNDETKKAYGLKSEPEKAQISGTARPVDKKLTATASASIGGKVIDDEIDILLTPILAKIDPKRKPNYNYRSKGSEWIRGMKPALVGMQYSALVNILKHVSSGGMPKEEQSEKYAGLNDHQIFLVRRAQLDDITVWGDRQMRQLAVYENAMQSLDVESSMLLIRGLKALLDG
jgi:hypothetical protein